MAIITVSRQYASGGSSIAGLVAQRLKWTLIDNDFVDRVAAKAGLPAQEVAQREERVAGLMERMARALAVSSPELFVTTGETPTSGPNKEDELVQVTERVIAEAVQHDHVVLVGRGAPAYLAERADTLHVYVVAPRDTRIMRAMERLSLGRKEAEKALDDIDHGRRDYVRQYYGRAWDDPANYDLVINTGKFTYQTAADLIVRAAGGIAGSS
jgi:cytidylate kinase